LLSSSKTAGCGLELAPDLEGFLKSKFPELIFSSDTEKKIKQAHKWAQEATDIPTEFDIVKGFLSEGLEVPEVEIKIVLPTGPEIIEDIPF
jgi:hypothetical protein